MNNDEFRADRGEPVPGCEHEIDPKDTMAAFEALAEAADEFRAAVLESMLPALDALRRCLKAIRDEMRHELENNEDTTRPS